MASRSSLPLTDECGPGRYSILPATFEWQAFTGTTPSSMKGWNVLKLMLVVPFLVGSAGGVFADEKSDPPPSNQTEAEPPDEVLTPEARQAVDDLKTQLSEDSEARAMLDSILTGSQLGPGEGWFAKAVSQTLFGWDYVSKTYDADDDNDVTAHEFSGTDDDFARIDRNEDQIVSQADFDWSRHSLARTPGNMLFFQADRDANGKLTEHEFVTLFKSLDTASNGFVSLDELRDQFQPPDEQTVKEKRAGRDDRPSQSTLILGLQRQEIGSLNPGPDVGDPAPDFTLNQIGGDDVTLSEQLGQQPVVLIFGNFTCGPFRSQAGNIEKLYERYKDRAKFFLVYVREAHPSDGWHMTSNKRAGIDVAQPAVQKQRIDVAQTCQRHLDLKLPFLVDTIDDHVGTAYSGMPNRLYLIDREGRIVFKNGRGPFGFHPRQLEQALVLLLNKR